MKICQNISKKFIGQLCSVFAMLLVGLSFTAGTAKAADIDDTGVSYTEVTVTPDSDGNSSYTATVPAGIDSDHSVLVCSTEPNWGDPTGDYSSKLYFDGAITTAAIRMNQNPGSYPTMIYYLNNPKNNYNYALTTNDADNKFRFKPNCFVISGVDVAGGWIETENIPNDALQENSSTGQFTAIFSGATKDHPVIAFLASGGNPPSSSNFSFPDSSALYYNATKTEIALIKNADNDGAVTFQTAGDQYWHYLNHAYIEVNPATPSGSSGVSITSQSYNPVTGKVTLTGTCQQQGSGINQMDLYAYAIGTSTPVSSEKEYPERSQLVNCSNGAWTAIFNGTGLTGSNRLVIDDSFFGTTIATVDVNWQTVTGFIKFDYGESDIIHIDTTPTDGATTTMNFVYNICDDPDYSATSSKILIGFQTGDRYQNDQISDEEWYQAATCYGTGSITFHLDHGQSGAIRAYYAYANSYDVIILKSGYFYINATYTEPIASSTALELFGSDTHDLACSETDWNATDTNWIGINGTKLKCTAIQGTFDTITVINNFFIKILSNLMNKVAANIFPLTIPVRIVESWNSSAYTNLPAEIQWLDIADADGNIYYTFPKEWTGQETDTQIPLWGKAVFGNTTSSLLFFNRIRSFMVYVIWSGFAWSFYQFAHEFYDEYMVEKTRKKHDINDYQL
jgi:hypothetical protein